MMRAFESWTGRESTRGLFLPRREHQFSRNPHTRATDNLAARPPSGLARQLLRLATSRSKTRFA